ncbi:MAG: D-aminoacylase, partial [Nitrospirota bacterium]
MLDIVIKNAVVIDGSNNAPERRDVGIVGDRIEAVDNIPDYKADVIIDATGLMLSPGFIDTHSHSDFTLLADPSGAGKVMQGVTTEINGNCGLSAAPISGDAEKQREPDLVELGIKERWSSWDEYIKLLKRKGIGLNFATLVGHGSIRASIIGLNDREASMDDMQNMKKFLKEGLSAGALGISTGLIYPLGIYTDTDELIELATVVSLHGGIYATHMRSEGEKLTEAVSEATDIGRNANIPVHISHLKTSGEKNWGKIDTLFKTIEAARDNGIDITCDRYPYTAASTDLDAVLPSWVYEGGREAEIERLCNRETRKRIERELNDRHPEVSRWEKVVIASVISKENKNLEGKNIFEISNILKKSPIDTILDLLLEEKLRVSAIYHSMSEENLRRILEKPYTMIGSDSSARSRDGITARGKPHPRGFGSFVRVLGKYVREESLLTFEGAIHKMTGMPALRFGLKKRGFIRKGYYADIVVFDINTIKDRATFDNPFQYPDGIVHVFVNGKAVVLDGKLTG